MFPQTYEGRDVMARLSVKLDRTVLTNNVDITVDGDSVTVTTPVFGGNVLVTTTFTGAGPHLAAFRPKSFAAEPSGGGAAEVVAAPVPDLGATGAAHGRRRARRGVHRAQARRGHHRRVGWPRPR